MLSLASQPDIFRGAVEKYRAGLRDYMLAICDSIHQLARALASLHLHPNYCYTCHRLKTRNPWSVVLLRHCVSKETCFIATN